jgi:hypothetical protein
MPKYHFSQGKILVVNGVYVHKRETDSGSNESVVLIKVQSSLKALIESEPTKEKDVSNAKLRQSHKRRKTD